MKEFSKHMQRMLFGAMAVLFSLSLFQSQWGMTMTDVTSPDHAVQPAKPTKAERLVEKHDCWTDEAPKGVIPGHVVTQHGYQGPVVTGRALDQLFAGEEHGLVIYGFCR